MSFAFAVNVFCFGIVADKPELSRCSLNSRSLVQQDPTRQQNTSTGTDLLATSIHAFDELSTRR